MNQPIALDSAPSQTSDWAENLGRRAGQHAALPFIQPTRLAAALDRLRHLHRTRQEVGHNYKAHEFIMGD